MSKALYRVIRALVWLFFPKLKVVGAEHLPEDPVILVGNHCQMNGPIAAELYMPRRRYTWCISQMMVLSEVPDYAFQDFWSKKPRSVRWLYRLLSYLIAPLSVCVFTNADTIPVYRDTRVLNTFRQTLARLKEGADVVIFPECYEPHNHIVYTFQDHFIDIARSYYRQTGKELAFVPVYLAPTLKTMVLGEPISFDHLAPIKEERVHICQALMDAVTELALQLPPHRVVPYPNVPKREYPMSREVTNDAKAGG